MLWLLFLATLACGPPQADTAEQPNPLTWDVGQPGPYQAGFRSWDISYAVEVGDSPRTITLNVWYPTLATEGEAVAYLGLHQDPEALGDAPLAASAYDGSYPVHLYSHGDVGWGGTSAFLMRHFASHGWVSIAPDHTNNTLVDNLNPRPTALYAHRPLDSKAALDALEALSSSEPLSQANTQAVLMSGHSFGCYTTWANAGASFDSEAIISHCPSLDEGGCSDDEVALFLSGQLDDPRVAAGITMAGAINRGFFGDQGHTTVHAPILLMSGTLDSPAISDSWEGMQGIERSWVEIEGACHQTFAMGVCSELPAQEGYDIINTYALAFARNHLLGDTDAGILAILDGSQPVSARVSFTGQ